MVKKKNLFPNSPETLVPYIKAKPNAQKITTATPKSVMFLRATLILIGKFLNAPRTQMVIEEMISKQGG